jgi:hypothetical protein
MLTRFVDSMATELGEGVATGMFIFNTTLQYYVNIHSCEIYVKCKVKISLDKIHYKNNLLRYLYIL